MLNLATIGGRLLALPAAALLGLLVLAGVALNEIKTTLKEDREAKVMAVIDMASGLVDHYQQQADAGVLTSEEAKRLAQQAIQSLRYEEVEYVWINDTSEPYPIMLMHPTVPALNGQALDRPSFNYATLLRNEEGSQVRQLDNENIFVAFTQTVKAFGSGFVEYQWPKPLAGGGVTEERFTKLSYIRLDPEWNWVIGSGIYVDDITEHFQALAWKIGLLALAVITVIWALSMFIRRWVLNQLGGEVAEARQLVNRVAEGDFTQINLGQKARPDSVLGSVNTMVKQLADMVRSVSEVSGRLNAAASDLNQVAEQGYTTQDQQTRETDQVATAIHEMSQTILDVANNAQRASQAATAADDEVVQGRTAVHEAGQAISNLALQIKESTQVIHQLREDSTNIGSVLEVIQDVAEQTNLLALNAAIEAARAGEAGRGFAVVADEVRALASRTQQSTEEIHRMISLLQEGAQKAVRMMDASIDEAESTISASSQAETALDSITRAAEEIRDMNCQIATAAEQQSSVASEINRNVTNLVGLCEDSSAATEQTYSSGQELTQLAQELNQRIHRFKI
ncbi:methyl-accepting chemotaxis protein [Marinospirillum perlucidum]|uniref:methyl-accepting chemotaxis protein n=1 Tax=Marinospirillum perlucidum TaxID=1982602 RepID=UPI000DF3A7BB|nr:methyl-accepting chemotaxis protein [Marinospirillum perlucidum]